MRDKGKKRRKVLIKYTVKTSEKKEKKRKKGEKTGVDLT